MVDTLSSNFTASINEINWTAKLLLAIFFFVCYFDNVVYCIYYWHEYSLNFFLRMHKLEDQLLLKDFEKHWTVWKMEIFLAQHLLLLMCSIENFQHQ